jgi:ion channel
MMAIQLAVGFLVSGINIVTHALATVAAISTARSFGLRAASWPRVQLMSVMVVTALVLMFTHALEILVWSLAYWFVGAAPEGTDLFYFAFVNYTTLGYGDTVPVKAWQLLGPMAAMTGILMFGWSTAVLFEVLMKTLTHLGAAAAPGSLFAEDPG